MVHVAETGKHSGFLASTRWHCFPIEEMSTTLHCRHQWQQLWNPAEKEKRFHILLTWYFPRPLPTVETTLLLKDHFSCSRREDKNTVRNWFIWNCSQFHIMCLLEMSLFQSARPIPLQKCTPAECSFLNVRWNICQSFLQRDTMVLFFFSSSSLKHSVNSDMSRQPCWSSWTLLRCRASMPEVKALACLLYVAFHNNGHVDASD